MAGIDLLTCLPKPCFEEEDTFPFIEKKMQFSRTIFMQKDPDVDQVRGPRSLGREIFVIKTCILKYN